MILIERLQKYLLYHQVKLVSMNILLVKKYCHLIEQAKFTYSPLGKTIEDHGKKQVDALESLKPFDKQLPSVKDFISKERLNPETVNEIERIEEEERKVSRSKMIYKASNETYGFRKFKTIRVFG